MAKPAFSDTRVFVSQATDQNRFTVMQDADGPIQIVVGANVTDERLERNAPTMLARYGVTLEELQQARQGFTS